MHQITHNQLFTISDALVLLKNTNPTYDRAEIDAILTIVEKEIGNGIPF